MEVVSQHSDPLEITSNETWDIDIQMYRDIVVKAGATLSITCKVAMATAGKIIVEKGAKIVIDGGIVTGWCKKVPPGTLSPLWEGIEVEGSNFQQLIHNFTGYAPDHGIVEVKPGSEISYAKNGIYTHNGGIIIANGGDFTNNVCGISMSNMPMAPGKSIIKNCTFQTTGLIGKDQNNNDIKPTHHIKFFNIRSIHVQGCTFEYAAGSTYLAQNRGQGINSVNSALWLDEYCSATPCTSGVRNTFENLSYGLYVNNFNPLLAVNVKNSDFLTNSKAATFNNCHMLLFENNAVLTDGPLQAWGLYLKSCKYYKVKNNSFIGDGTLFVPGIVAFDSRYGAHEIYRNNIRHYNSAILAHDDNGGALGLKANCNVFNEVFGNDIDICVQELGSTSPPPTVMSIQGQNQSDVRKWVRNLYGASYANDGKFLVSSANQQVIEHTSTPNGADNPHIPTVQASPQVDVKVRFEQFNHVTHCLAVTPSGPGGGGGGGSSSTQRIGEMNDYIEDLHANNTNNTNDYEIQSTVGGKLNIFLSDTVEGFQDSVISVLNANQGMMNDADVLEVFAYLATGDFTTAVVKVDDLDSSRADWKTYFTHLVELLEHEDGIFALLNDEDEEEFFRDYADSEGKEGQASAQGIIEQVFGEAPDYPVVFPDGWGARYATTGVQQNISEDETPIKVFPNPTNGAVTLRFSGNKAGVLTVKLYNMQGSEIQKEVVSAREKETNLWIGQLPGGAYLITLFDEQGTLLHKEVIIKE